MTPPTDGLEVRARADRVRELPERTSGFEFGVEPVVAEQHDRKQHDYAEQERDDLVLRERRQEHADRDARAAHQQRAEIAAPYRTGVEIAEVPDGPRHHERRKQTQSDEREAREELAEHDVPRVDGRGEQELDRPLLALLRPHAHHDAGNEDREGDRHPTRRSSRAVDCLVLEEEEAEEDEGARRT